MQAVCATCGKVYEVAAEGMLGACVSCGGVLTRVVQMPPIAAVPPVVTAPPVTVAPPVATQVGGGGSASEPAKADPPPPPPAGETLELVGEPLTTGIKCPNCGHFIEAGAEICTACGYSRRLGRTLTTRVGMPEIPRHKPAVVETTPDEPEIEAEKEYKRAKTRGRGTKTDTLRLFVALVWIWLMGGVVMLAPTGWLKDHVPLVLPAVLAPPAFDQLNASLVMLLFFVISVPITATGVRMAASITNVEINPYLSWLRTAGVLAAVLCTMEVVYTTDQVIVHMEPRWLLVSLAAEGAVALLVFAWYLHDVRLSAAIVLWFAILLAGAVGLLVAAVAYYWIASHVGVTPVIPPVNQWKVPGI